MKKLIYTTILITLFSYLAIAQETTVWLNGSKSDAEIIKKKARIESQGFKVFINDAAEREKRHLAQPTPSGDEKFDRIFREARELFDKEEWAKAAAKFNEIACDCPENKQVDAALYWLAYSYKKLGKVKETNATIERLLKNFPNSTWADDARVLKYEVATSNVVSVARPGQIREIAPRFDTTNPSNLLLEAAIGENYVFAQETKLDREDEIRLAAFQSLLTNDPPKAIETIGRLLQSDSKASETLKTEVIRSTRGYRWTINIGKGVGGDSEALELIKQITPLLRNALVKGFQNQSSLKIRSEIINSIAAINDETSYNFLAQTYPNESDKGIKKAIILAFGGGSYTFYSGQAYTPLEYWNGATWVNGRTENTARVTTVSPASQAGTGSFSQAGTGSSNQTPKTNPIRELRLNSLMTIFRNEKDLELRRLALGSIQGFAGWSTKDGMIDSLSQLYDSENDEQFKTSIIYSFSRLTKNQQATNKLLDIAKNDKSDKMRLEAIRALRNNKSPEVTSFLESLIQ